MHVLLAANKPFNDLINVSYSIGLSFSSLIQKIFFMSYTNVCLFLSNFPGIS